MNGSLRAQSAYDVTGLEALWQLRPDLRGTGVNVATIEAGAARFNEETHFDPTKTAWYDTSVWYFNTTAPYSSTPSSPLNSYRPALESEHSNSVAQIFSEIAPDVDLVEQFYYRSFITDLLINHQEIEVQQTPIQAQVVNQSYVLAGSTDYMTNLLARSSNLVYDHYVNNYGTLFVNAVRNVDSELYYAPGSMYNGITVGTSTGNHSAGVHLTGPSEYSSFATSYVSGIATLLHQAIQDLTSPPEQISAVNPRVLKALLINNADKTHLSTWGQSEFLLETGLDARFGAGMVHALKSYQNLMAGQIKPQQAAQNSGWDLETAQKDIDQIYYLSILGTELADFNATLVWNAIATPVYDAFYDKTENLFAVTGDNLVSSFTFSLYLMEGLNETLISQRFSPGNFDPYNGDNVLHMHLQDLAPGDYQLRVTLNNTANNPDSDLYAIAFYSVPEPGSALLSLLALSLFSQQRQRRSSH